MAEREPGQGRVDVPFIPAVPPPRGPKRRVLHFIERRRGVLLAAIVLITVTAELAFVWPSQNSVEADGATTSSLAVGSDDGTPTAAAPVEAAVAEDTGAERASDVSSGVSSDELFVLRSSPPTTESTPSSIEDVVVPATQDSVRITIAPEPKPKPKAAPPPPATDAAPTTPSQPEVEIVVAEEPVVTEAPAPLPPETFEEKPTATEPPSTTEQERERELQREREREQERQREQEQELQREQERQREREQERQREREQERERERDRDDDDDDDDDNSSATNAAPAEDSGAAPGEQDDQSRRERVRDQILEVLQELFGVD